MAPTRIGGADRYETAALLAAEVLGALADDGRALGGVLVASGEDAAGGIDALSAGFLAGHLGAPVLLTARDALPGPTADALRALPGAASGEVAVHVMGGEAVVSAAVLHALGALGATATRVAGSDRYGTAAAAALLGAPSVASCALLAGAGRRRTAVLASGTSPADALAAGPLVAAARVPLLLTARDALPGATADALRSLAVEQVVVLGGPAVVSTRVLDALSAMGLGVLTVRGEDRYDTAAVLLALAAAPPLDAGGDGDVGGFGLPLADAAQGYLVGGARFPDALACGPLAGARRRPLLLTDPTGLSAATAALLPATAVRSLVAVGGPGALPQAVVDAAAAAAAG